MEFGSVEPGGYYLTPQRKELLEETGMDFNFVEEDELPFRSNFFYKT
jgi:ethanolamine utilization cobalamin adenosyltransferase